MEIYLSLSGSSSAVFIPAIDMVAYDGTRKLGIENLATGVVWEELIGVREWTRSFSSPVIVE